MKRVLHPRVRRMRERLGELHDLALDASDQREVDRILYLYVRGEITRREALQRLRKLAGRGVVRVRDWSELPDVLEPGIFSVDGVILRLEEPLEKDEARELVSLIKRIHGRYYA